jgi:hydrogenase-4 component E
MVTSTPNCATLVRGYQYSSPSDLPDSEEINVILLNDAFCKVHKSALPIFYQLILTMVAFFISIGISFMFKDTAITHSFLIISISAMLCGLLLIITHKRIFSHMVGFLVLENAVFLFSIAAGTEMPMLINTGIFIDLIITTLILSVFLTKVNERNPNLESDKLTQLKD